MQGKISFAAVLTLISLVVGNEIPLEKTEKTSQSVAINKDQEQGNKLPLSVTLEKIEGNSDVWKTPEGKLCKIIPIETDNVKAKPVISERELEEKESPVIERNNQRSENEEMISEPLKIPNNLLHLPRKYKPTANKNEEHPNKMPGGSREGRFFWPFTNWFGYGYNDYPMYNDYPPYYQPPPPYYQPPPPMYYNGW